LEGLNKFEFWSFYIVSNFVLRISDLTITTFL